jgi:hypothetical protein
LFVIKQETTQDRKIKQIEMCVRPGEINQEKSNNKQKSRKTQKTKNGISQKKQSPLRSKTPETNPQQHKENAKKGTEGDGSGQVG